MSDTPQNLIPRRAARSRFAAAVVVGGLIIGLGQAAAQDDVDLDDLREQREDAREEQLLAQAAFDAIDAEFEDVRLAFEAADELVELAETRAESITTQLELAQLRLARTEVGLAWAEYDQAAIGEEMAELAINEYVGIDDSPSLLAESDPTEAMAREAVLDMVQGAGYDVVDTARAAQSRFTELRAQAEADIAEVERLTSELRAELDELEAAREVRERARDTIEQRRGEWLDRVDELERQEADFTDQIKAEQRRLDAERARARAAAEATERAEAASAGLDASASAEGYVWPTAGGIGSYFGNRVHPILGYSRLHGGLDIGGRMGQPIWAAKEGTVILAGVNGGYGNTIVIDHGNGYATLYGHQSTYEVRKGDYVETGQHIGNVGSTGLSTGPHLHFEVRIDGSVVDPLPYMPPR